VYRLLRAAGLPSGRSYPGRLGYWPAVFGLFAFVWLELVPRDSNTTLPTLRLYFACYLAVHLLAATYFGLMKYFHGFPVPKTPMVVEHGRLVLRFEKGFKNLAGERVFVRLRQLARLIGREPVMETGERSDNR
jgi:hypothetical protein